MSPLRNGIVRWVDGIIFVYLIHSLHRKIKPSLLPLKLYSLEDVFLRLTQCVLALKV